MRVFQGLLWGHWWGKTRGSHLSRQNMGRSRPLKSAILDQQEEEEGVTNFSSSPWSPTHSFFLYFFIEIWCSMSIQVGTLVLLLSKRFFFFFSHNRMSRPHRPIPEPYKVNDRINSIRPKFRMFGNSKVIDWNWTYLHFQRNEEIGIKLNLHALSCPQTNKYGKGADESGNYPSHVSFQYLTWELIFTPLFVQMHYFFLVL